MARSGVAVVDDAGILVRVLARSEPGPAGVSSGDPPGGRGCRGRPDALALEPRAGDAAEPTPRRLAALDGLRGIAVLAVVVYHLAPDRLPGGFLGVSMFFVLSGFLITSLLVAESDRSGRVDLRRFWGRRGRRLLPAASLGLVTAVAVAALVGDPHQLQTLPGDVAAAAAYVANWHFITEGVAYGVHYQQPGVVQHFWSLAIEEQFYVGVAVLAFVLARLSASRRTWLLVFGALALASVGATLASSSSVAVYYGTGTRAFELLAGAVLAIVVAGRISSARPDQVATGHVPADQAGTARAAGPDRSRRRWLDPLGAAALLALAGAFALVELEDSIVSRGGLWIVAGLTVVVLVAARSTGWLSRALSWRPLTVLGVVSYGVYVFHWPLFVLISPDTMAGPAWAVPVVRIAVTAAFTIVSYRLVERPVRLRRWALPPVRVAAVVSVTFLVVVGASIALGRQAETRAVVAAPDVVVPGAQVAPPAATPTSTVEPADIVVPGLTFGPARSSAALDPSLASDPAEGPDAIRSAMVDRVATTFASSGVPFPLTPATVLGDPGRRGERIHRAVVMGDSMVQDAFPALRAAFATQGIEASVVGGRAQTLLTGDGRWLVDLHELVDQQDPDVVVLESCCGSQDPVVLPTGREALADDPAFWVAWEAMVDMATDLAAVHGAQVMWVIPPPADGDRSRWYGDVAGRMARVGEIGRDLVRAQPRVALVDWSVFSAPDGGYAATMTDRSGRDVTVRAADGVHFSPAGQALQAESTVAQVLVNWDRRRDRGP